MILDVGHEQKHRCAGCSTNLLAMHHAGVHARQLETLEVALKEVPLFSMDGCLSCLGV